MKIHRSVHVFHVFASDFPTSFAETEKSCSCVDFFVFSMFRRSNDVAMSFQLFLEHSFVDPNESTRFLNLSRMDPVDWILVRFFFHLVPKIIKRFLHPSGHASPDMNSLFVIRKSSFEVVF